MKVQDALTLNMLFRTPVRVTKDVAMVKVMGRWTLDFREALTVKRLVSWRDNGN